MEEQDLQPDAGEVLQEEAPLTAVPVCLDGPVRVQELPRKAGSAFTRPLLTGGRPVQLLTADAYRARLTLMATAAVRIAFSQSAAEDDSTSVLWPATVPFVCDARVELWARVDGDADGAVSVVTERWAAGE